MTDAFNLNAQFIIHACVPKWIDGGHNEYDLLCSAYIAALQMADLLNCTTIAFPFLASGNNKFDKGMALEIAVKCMESFESKHLQQAAVNWFKERKHQQAILAAYAVVLKILLKNQKEAVKTVEQVAHIVMDAL